MQCAEKQNDKYNALNNVLFSPLDFCANMYVGCFFSSVVSFNYTFVEWSPIYISLYRLALYMLLYQQDFR